MIFPDSKKVMLADRSRAGFTVSFTRYTLLIYPLPFLNFKHYFTFGKY